MKYVFSTNNGRIIHSIDFKKSENKKLGAGSRVVQTYHFSVDQVLAVDLSHDEVNCMDCPYSFNQNGGKSGGCYTHKGFQRLGLYAKLRSLNKMLKDKEIQPFDVNILLNYVTIFAKSKVDLLRFGAYGEPVLLPIEAVELMISKFREKSGKTFWTGYTHQWHKDEYQEYSKYFMASVHNKFEEAIALDKGFKFFGVGYETEGINCPASKEAGKKTTCSVCKLCSGTKGKSNKSIYIAKH